MNPNVAKSDAEWWAARRIEELESALEPFADPDIQPSARAEKDAICMRQLSASDLRKARAILQGKA